MDYTLFYWFGISFLSLTLAYLIAKKRMRE